MPEVSVIIPVYNATRLIGAALHSVFAQTFRDFEVIVVDDGSEDDLGAAIAPWGDRIVCVRQSNRGPASARNTGIARSTGRLLAFLDADDEWLPEKLARQVAYFERFPSTGLLHTGVADRAQDSAAGPAPPRHAFCDLFHTRFFIQTLTAMVPRLVLDEVGGFDERRQIHVEDWDLWLRIAAKFPIGYLPEALAIHRPGGLMSRHLDRTYAGQALVVRKNRRLCAAACAEHRAAPERCLRAREHVLFRDWGRDRLRLGDRAGARVQLLKALVRAPFDVRTGVLCLSSFVRRSRPAFSRTAAIPSLVHDTLYRRARQRIAHHLHAVDDGVFRRSRSRPRVLFEATTPATVAIFRPVYERLRRDPRLELLFTARNDVWDARSMFSSLGVDDTIVPSAKAAWLKVDAYLNADFWGMTWLHRRTRRIHLFHGVAGKYGLDAPVDLAPLIAAFDCLMFPNDDRRRRYIDASLVPEDDPKTALVGYPKVDCLVDGSLDRDAIARQLGLRRDTPTIIYAPTWSPYSSLHVMGEAVIERLASEGWQVVVKLHDRSYDPHLRASGGVDWAARLARLESHASVRVVRAADACPYLAVSDLMVTDHSSVGFEFMLLDRPIVVLDCPELLQHAAVSPDKVQRMRSAAAVAGDAASVVRAVSRELQGPLRASPARQRIASELFYRPGTATDRAVALIYQLVGIPARAPDASPGAAADRESDRELAPVA